LDELLEAKLESPLYTAVMGCVPTVKVEIVKLAVVPVSVAVPIAVAPSWNDTVPVGVPVAELTVAVSVRDWP